MYYASMILALAIFLAVNAHFWRTGLLSVFHPFTYYSAFHFIVFVFRPLLAYHMEYDIVYGFGNFYPSMQTRIIVSLAASLGFVVFYITCVGTGRTEMIFKGDAARSYERFELRRALPVMLIVCLPLALYSLVTSISNASLGVTTMVDAGDAIINTTGVGYISEAMRFLVPICALVAWFYRFRWYALVPLVAFFVLKASTGGRALFILAVAVTGLLYLYDRRDKLPPVRFAVLGALMLVFFTFVGDDRGYRLRQTLGFVDAEVTYAYVREERFLEGMDFANKEYFEYIVHVVPERSGTYDYFLLNLQLFTEPVPRVLWPDKPVGAPIKPVNIWAYGTPRGFTWSMPGTGWLQLGWIGVIIWCGLWGWACGRFYEWFVKSDQSALKVATYVVSLTSLLIVFRDGTVVTLARGHIFYMFPLIVLWAARNSMRLPTLRQIQRHFMERWARDQRAKRAQQRQLPQPGAAPG